MATGRKEQLDQVIVAIQERWGSKAIGLSRDRARAVSPVSTGFPELDAALGIGGLPRGRISELIGSPTSGAATVALKILANAQHDIATRRAYPQPAARAGALAHREASLDRGRPDDQKRGGMVVYIDLDRTFDPDYARRCGVQLEQMMLVHPHDAGQALNMLADFVLSAEIDLLIFDMPARLQIEPPIVRQLTSILGRLLAPLDAQSSTLLFLTSLLAAEPEDRPLTPGPCSPRGEGDRALISGPSSAEEKGSRMETTLPHFAAVRLLLQRERWLYQHRDVYGYEARVQVLKNKLAPAGQPVSIIIAI
jgi:recombination protein RecA